MRAVQWRTAAILALAAWLPPRLAGQTGFNGVITFQQDRDGKMGTFVQTTKGRRVRLDGFGSDSGTVIIDGDTKSMMMVEPSEKKYFVMTEADAKQMAALMGPMLERMKNSKSGNAGDDKVNFKNTGRHETVAGVRCDVWHGSSLGDEDHEGDACLAAGVGFDVGALVYANPLMQRGGRTWNKMEQYRSLIGDNKGILKATRLENGKSTVEMEAVKIEPKTVSDDLFKPPAGYTAVRMSDMMMKAHNAMKQK